MMTRRLVLSLLVASALGIAHTGCDGNASGDASKDEGAKETKVVVTQVRSGDFRRSVELATTVEGYESAQLMSKIGGYVAQIHVDIGDEVQQGQPLAVLHAPELEDEVERQARLVIQAEADLNSRQAEIMLAGARLEEYNSLLELRNIELQRASNLVNKGALKQQKLDEAEYAVRSTQAAIKSMGARVDAADAMLAAAIAHREVALAELSKAESMAAYRTITAPFNGVITRRLVDPGAFVRPASSSAAMPLFHIARVDKVRLIVFLPLDQAGALDVGDEVVLDHIEGLPIRQLDVIGGEPITIDRYAKSFDTSSRMMRAEIDIDNVMLLEETGKQLRPGDYGKVILTLETYNGIPTVPASALGSTNGASYVVVVDSNDTCLEIPVTVQITNGDVVGLASGVQVGHEIVAQDINRVQHKQILTTGAKQYIDFNPSP